MWRSIGKGVLNKTIDVKVQAQKCLNFDVKRFVKYSFSYGTSQMYLFLFLLGGLSIFKQVDCIIFVH